MNNQVKSKNKAPAKLPDDSFNENLTAIPRQTTSEDEASEDPDMVSTPMGYGDMNLKDAEESGYIENEDQEVDVEDLRRPGQDQLH